MKTQMDTRTKISKTEKIAWVTTLGCLLLYVIIQLSYLFGRILYQLGF